PESLRRVAGEGVSKDGGGPPQDEAPCFPDPIVERGEVVPRQPRPVKNKILVVRKNFLPVFRRSPRGGPGLEPGEQPCGQWLNNRMARRSERPRTASVSGPQTRT